MDPLARRLLAGPLLALTLLGLAAPSASAAIKLPFLSPPPPPPPPPPPAKVVEPVAAPIATDPASGPARGTVIMVHAGGWAGHDAHAQELLAAHPGDIFAERGWRVVSIDYEEGTAGLDDVLSTAGAELTRRTGNGPLCIYGESSGAHLALVAASRLRSIDCVIGLGTPTDIPLYETDGAASPDHRIRIVANQMTRFFGSVAADVAAWDPVTLAPSIHADVLLIREADDDVVPAAHIERFDAARPQTETVVLEAGDRSDPTTGFVHGHVTAAGRTAYGAAIGSFADRAIAAREAELKASQLGCTQVSRSMSEIGVGGLTSALRCLAARDGDAVGAGTGRWRSTSVRVRGQINAARVWASLRATASGRRALRAAARRRAIVVVRSTDPLRVMLRAARRGGRS